MNTKEQIVLDAKKEKADKDAITCLSLINNGDIWGAAMHMMDSQPNTVANILSSFAGSKTSCGVYDKDDAYQDTLENLHRNLENGGFRPIKFLISNLHLDKAHSSGLITEELFNILTTQEKYLNDKIKTNDMEWVSEFCSALCADLALTYKCPDLTWKVNSNYAYTSQALMESRTRGIAFERNISEGHLKRLKRYEAGTYRPKKDDTVRAMELLSAQKMVYTSALEETNEALERNISYSAEDFSEALCQQVVSQNVIDCFISLGGKEDSITALNKGKAIRGYQQKAMFATAMIRLGLVTKNDLPQVYANAIESFVERL